MTTNIEGYWDKKKEKLKVRYPMISEADLSYNEGKEREMLELLGYKLGKSKEELLKIIVGI